MHWKFTAEDEPYLNDTEYSALQTKDVNNETAQQ